MAEPLPGLNELPEHGLAVARAVRAAVGGQPAVERFYDELLDAQFAPNAQSARR